MAVTSATGVRTSGSAGLLSTVISACGKYWSQVCCMTSALSAGSCSPRSPSPALVALDLSEKSALPTTASTRTRYGRVLSEWFTTLLMNVGVSRPPVVKLMIAARLAGFSAAPENSAQLWSSNGTPDAGTGFRATSRATRQGLAAAHAGSPFRHRMPDQRERSSPARQPARPRRGRFLHGVLASDVLASP